MSMTPREIVEELDKHIIGQHEAKRAVAIALRNRWRRAQIDEPLRSEVTPKNILMIGPTGVGKTEIARRLAKLANAPFIKVEATKFTEVGYVGRDVDSIVRDLVDMAVKMERENAMARVGDRALDAAEDRLLDALLPGTGQAAGAIGFNTGAAAGPSGEGRDTRQRFRKMLREHALDDREVELEVQAAPPGVEIVKDAAGQPTGVFVETRLNGEVVQHGTTQDMVFGVATLIEYITAFMTLLPGDVILTGTPEGVGAIVGG